MVPRAFIKNGQAPRVIKFLLQSKRILRIISKFTSKVYEKYAGSVKKCEFPHDLTGGMRFAKLTLSVRFRPVSHFGSREQVKEVPMTNVKTHVLEVRFQVDR